MNWFGASLSVMWMSVMVKKLANCWIRGSVLGM